MSQEFPNVNPAAFWAALVQLTSMRLGDQGR
eukprot:CAMPEP_0174360588 /NCGR_PEP_ID=MMETSP0811_2-20130205/54986_1 /TAXON_ID=73025 ORGANISM="Eutreptiella gymnastica-like, Strain CCMP1594" /NCGR_SAMPLE_ID=MMETSP0811_2 /ASSEMBLY_ACC=CAM_ASM_000667 /LENGTH=30 /DNA_ID= /DNA_START= /DNA_END= /DNA_ORIENTATION=